MAYGRRIGTELRWRYAARVTTTSGDAAPVRGWALVPALLRLVRFAHTVFALPFALAGAVLAERSLPGFMVVVWIVVAMAGARSLAMALNRLIDAEIDARNPRTADRELPAGRLTRAQVWGFSVVSLAVLLLAVSQLPPLVWVLWPVPVALFVLYPYAKRFTRWCHLVLGVTIGLAPVGGWIAVTGEFAPGAILFGCAVAAWIAGFDIVYALLDLDFDRSAGVHSLPAAIGAGPALVFSRVLHAAAVVFLAATGAAAGAGPAFFAGVVIVALLLIAEHRTARSLEPAAINRAFGPANAAIAVIVLVAVLADLVSA